MDTREHSLYHSHILLLFLVFVSVRGSVWVRVEACGCVWVHARARVLEFSRVTDAKSLFKENVHFMRRRRGVCQPVI